MRLKGKAPRAGVIKCKNKECRKQYTVTVATIFHSSHVPLRKWIAAYWLMCSAKKGYSANQLSRDVDVTYKTAWFMAHRIRHAMRYNSFKKLDGDVEVDETYVGGKAKNKRQSYHARKKREKEQRKTGKNSTKVPVMALVERDGSVKSQVLYRVSAKKLRTAIELYVDPKATVHTDELPLYRGIGHKFAGGHKTVNHSINEYVNGDCTTNTVESYFALLKRGVIGIYHHVSTTHLQRYCDEFVFRWDHRKLSIEEAFNRALQLSDGKRLSYKGRIKRFADKSWWRSDI